MPIYENEISKAEMEKLARTEECAECGCLLLVAWSAEKNCYMLRCGNDLSHTGIKRPYDPGPYDIPGFNLFNLKGRSRKMEQTLGEAKSKLLAPYTGVVSLTRDQATKVLQTIWPKAPAEEIFKAALICKSYGLNPLMGHLFLVPFKTREGQTWATIVGIKATRLIASRCQHYSYLDGTPRVMTEKEQIATLGEVDPNNIMAITKLKAKDGSEAQGYGSWPKDSEPYGTDKGNSKAKMAFIRSERDALNRLFPGEMPSGVEIADEQFLPLTEAVAKEEKAEPPRPPGAQGASKARGTITQPQVNKIWGDAKKMGYEVDEVHAIIKKRYEVDSVNDLSIAQASQLIDMIAKGEGLPAAETDEGEE